MLSQVNLDIPKPTYNTRPEVNFRAAKSITKANQANNELEFSGKLGNYITHPVLSMRVLPKLNDQAQKEAYLELFKATDQQGKADLKFLLDTGKLFSNDADDGSGVLQNLQRIIREPKANGLDAKVILNSTLRALANPYSITQDFGHINNNVAQLVMQDPRYSKIASAVGVNPTEKKVSFLAVKKQPNTSTQPQTMPSEYNVEASGTCVAASMEFNLADKRPAEFARYAAELSSPKMSVTEAFKFTDISDNMLEAIYWLDQFNVKYEATDYEGGLIELKPDDAAIYRAISQSQTRKTGSRSAVDVLMQSTFMQLGSAASYNSLSDIRTGGFNQSNRGLTEFEKSMAEAIIDDNGGKSSVTYQIVDDNAFLQGYNKNYQETLMEIINSLKSGNNIIAGITESDSNGKIIGGHEITIVASKVGKDGKLYFVCNDTDDNLDKPTEMLADELIPKIHHAGIPNIVIKRKANSQQKPINIQLPANVNANLPLPKPSNDPWKPFNITNKEVNTKLNRVA